MLSIPAGRAGASHGAFRLTKWYLDCVASDGRAAVAYWAAVRYGRLECCWQSVTLYAPGGPADRRSAVAASEPPARSDGTVAWRAPALGLVIRTDQAPPLDAVRLLECDDGALTWCCEAPAADVTVEIEGAGAVRGAGYVEQLDLTLPPWRLPIRELRWGRWIASDRRRTLVWIDWRGPEPRTWVFLDGARVDGSVTGESIATSGATLTLLPGRTLECRTLDDYVRPIPALARLLPATLRALGETKWLAPATLSDRGSPPLDGRAVHELVVFP